MATSDTVVRPKRTTRLTPSKTAPRKPAAAPRPKRPLKEKVRETIQRFHRPEILFHWAIALPFLVCYLSALTLIVVYNPEPTRPLRDLFSWAHRISGLCLLVLPALVLLTAPGSWRLHLENIRQGWVWTIQDIVWLFKMGRSVLDKSVELPEQAKFNAGEKLNFMMVSTTCPLFVLTGILIWLPGVGFFAWSIHVVMGLVATPLMLGHIFMATINADTRVGLSGMITGRVDREWAKHHYTRWYCETFESREPVEDLEPGVPPAAPRAADAARDSAADEAAADLNPPEGNEELAPLTSESPSPTSDPIGGPAPAATPAAAGSSPAAPPSDRDPPTAEAWSKPPAAEEPEPPFGVKPMTEVELEEALGDGLARLDALFATEGAEPGAVGKSTPPAPPSDTVDSPRTSRKTTPAGRACEAAEPSAIASSRDRPPPSPPAPENGSPRREPETSEGPCGDPPPAPRDPPPSAGLADPWLATEVTAVEAVDDDGALLPAVGEAERGPESGREQSPGGNRPPRRDEARTENPDESVSTDPREVTSVTGVT